jgi:hypothetical protein
LGLGSFQYQRDLFQFFNPDFIKIIKSKQNLNLPIKRCGLQRVFSAEKHYNIYVACSTIIILSYVLRFSSFPQ